MNTKMIMALVRSYMGTGVDIKQSNYKLTLKVA